MRWLRDPSGRLPERPHYDLAEIDQECESRLATFLRHRHGAVRYPLPTNDLTILLEQETSDLDLYADFAHEGNGSPTVGQAIEGVTEFVPGDKPRVRIARHLSEDPAREHRLRTTLAHELGHVWFHAFLWAAPPGARQAAGAIDQNHTATRRSPDSGLRTQDSGLRAWSPAYRGCAQGAILHARPADWLEWQAGYASGAVLLPATPLRRLIEQAQAAHAFRVTLATAAGAALLSQIERAFDVSREAARVRLAASGLLPGGPGSSGAGASRRRPVLRVQRQRRAPVLGTG